ncbi:hypothetical protein FJ960_28065 [Mesorhizobium sp. B2-3-11]|nr:hypothetical protein FJ960_28065 [Mesorhizobium sp. B2-3-11]
MARYFFDAGDSNAVIKGEVGIECDGIVAARREAMEGLIFGLLRHVLPARQLGIARLMIAMDRVTFTYGKMLVALTPQGMLAEGFNPAMIANVSED